MQYDAETSQPGLFGGYVNLFLKLKQESSGYPHDVKTEEAKACYIRDYFEREDIVLDSDNIEYNPAMRCLSKNMANNLWGKFSQRNNLLKSTIINEGTEFFRLLFDQSVEVADFHILNLKAGLSGFK